MDITAFIRELLFGHDCVIVPGFGGFIGNYTPARLDKKTGTFFPPLKQISFNRNLNHNDGLLIGKISGTTGMNYGDSRNLVEEFVSDIRKKLEKGEKVVFDHIGSFTTNQENSIQFEPDRSSNYNLDSYGLESFQLLPLEGYDVRSRISRHIVRDPVKQASLKKILWRAAVIVPLISAIILIPVKTNLFRSKIESTTMNPLVSAEFEQNRIAVDEGVNKEKVKDDEIAGKAIEEQPKSEPAPESKIPPPVANGTNVYYLITGSFKSEGNAVAQAEKLKSEGFTPEIVVAPNGFFRVCAIACRDLNSALTKKDSIAALFPGAWISKKI